MIWNNHKDLEGKHSFLGASQWRWITWDDRTLQARFVTQFAQLIGTAIHELAHDCISSGIKLNRTDKHLIDMCMYKNYVPRYAYDSEYLLGNLISYVNDAIGFHMSSEIILYYSANAFGTTDAISYNEKEKILRIHDLKTGTGATFFEQLFIYAAYFCLEYNVKPTELNKIYLRIYQNGEFIEVEPDPMEIEKIMKLAKSRDLYVQDLKGVRKKWEQKSNI